MSGTAPARPIFVIGMPRSGTTVLFETLARHPALGWPSNYSRVYPAWPAMNIARRLLDNRVIRAHGRKKQYGRVLPLNRLLPQPDEAYEFWNHWSRQPFAGDALADTRLDDTDRERLRGACRALLKWQGRTRFAAKLTGPSRIAFLDQAFPDAHYVHLVRDGRAVVHSLLNVAFWRQQGGLERPFWNGLLEPDDEKLWREHDRDPGVLAALQWRRMIATARVAAASLGTGRYVEYRYEDLLRDPGGLVERLLGDVGLEPDASVAAAIAAGPQLRNMNFKFERDFDAAYIARLTAVMQPVLAESGYP